MTNQEIETLVKRIYKQLERVIYTELKWRCFGCQDTIDEYKQEARVKIWEVIQRYPEGSFEDLCRLSNQSIRNRYNDLTKLKTRYEARVGAVQKPMVTKVGPYEINASNDLVDSITQRLGSQRDRDVFKGIQEGKSSTLIANDLYLHRMLVWKSVQNIRKVTSELIA